MSSNKTSSNPDGYIVLTELTERENGKNKPAIGALHLKRDANGLELINIASVYGLRKAQLQKGLNDNLLYWNTKKGTLLADTFGLQLPAYVSDATLLSDANIKTENDLKQDDDAQSSLPPTNAELESQIAETVERYGGEKAYKKAKAKGKTKLNYKQWVQVRTPEFKSWFGDWELANKSELINRAKIINISENNYPIAEIKVIYSKLGQATNKQDGKIARFVNGSLGKILNHKGIDAKQIIPRLDDIFEASIPIYFEQEVLKDGHKKHDNFIGYHNYLAKVSINDKEYYVRTTVQEVKAKPSTIKKGFVPNELHSTFISAVVLYKKTPAVHTKIINEATDTEVKGKISPLDKKLQQFFDDVKQAQANTSKVTDPDTGEPLVVYHGTRASERFSVFDMEKSNPNLKGAYFSDVKEFALRWAGNKPESLYEVFLNIKNPNYGGFDRAGIGAIMTLFEHRDGGIFTKRQTDDYGKKGQKEFIVGHPNQIKSAIGNNGAFSSDSDDIRFSLNEDNDSEFAKAVDAVYSSNNKTSTSEWVEMGTTPKALIQSGIADTKMLINIAKITKIKNNHSEITADMIKQIPSQLNNPVIVFKNTKKGSPKNSYVVITELQATNGDMVIVPLHANKTNGGLVFNKIASIYGRNEGAKYITNMVNYADVKYVDKQKAYNIQRRLQLREAGTLNRLFDKSSVLKDDNSVNTEKDLTQDDDAQSSLPPTNAELESQIAETVERYGGQKAYKKAKAKGKTKLNYKQWVQVRTPEFKSWFGDWELASSKVKRTASNILQARTHASEFKGKVLENIASGIQATVSRNALDKMLSASALGKSVSHQAHLSAVSNLDSLFEKALVGWDKPDRDNDRHIKAVTRFFTPMSLKDKVYLVKLTVKQIDNKGQGNRIYTVESLDVTEKSPVPEMVDADLGQKSDRPHRAIDSLVEQIQKYKPDDVSKVINPDTGEPLVMYHGTNADFDTFMSGFDNNGISHGEGFYLTSDVANANSYTGGDIELERLFRERDKFNHNDFNTKEYADIEKRITKRLQLL